MVLRSELELGEGKQWVVQGRWWRMGGSMAAGSGGSGGSVKEAGVEAVVEAGAKHCKWKRCGCESQSQ